MYHDNQTNQMKLSIITNPYDIKFEADTINRLFREGLSELHIRKPKYDKEMMTRFIKQIDQQYHDRIVLHSYYSLVNKFNIKKIHLSHDWISNFATNWYLNKVILQGKHISKSKTIANCARLFKPIEGVDEVILGPVFSRASYTVNTQLVQTADLEKGLRHSKLPVTALGGVTAQTLGFLKNVGFKGIAIQSGVWKSPDPVKAFAEMRDFYFASEQRLRIAV
jgi:thiamine monophosphate synthase